MQVKTSSSTEIFCLGYDKEEIVASRTIFWVGVEVISDLLVNECSKKLVLVDLRPSIGN